MLKPRLSQSTQCIALQCIGSVVPLAMFILYFCNSLHYGERCLNPTQSHGDIFQVGHWKFCACLHYDAADESDNDDYDIDYDIIGYIGSFMLFQAYKK